MELSVTEAAALLGRSPRTVRAQVARGELPGVKRDGQWFVRRASLPLTEAQRAALQAKADDLRQTLDDALPSRLADTLQRRKGLADLDAFRLGAELLARMRATDAAPLDAIAALERALRLIAEASYQYDREARRVALIEARAALGQTGAALLLACGLSPREPALSWMGALESHVLPAVAGFARWAERSRR